MQGENVTLYIKSAGEEDAHGDPAVTWTPQEVDGALAYELAGSDLSDADMPDGTRVTARVQLPDATMAGLSRDALKGARIALTDRGQTFDDAYWVIGSPNYAPNLPTGWNTTIALGRTDG